MSDIPVLIRGPYWPPRCDVGQKFPCSIRGPRVVRGMTDAPISWPFAYAEKGKRQLLVSGDLERAIRGESAKAVAYHFGVSRDQVQDWRRSLGVGRMTAGTTALWRSLFPSRIKHRGPGQIANLVRRMSPDRIAEMRRRIADGETRTAIAAELGLSRQHVGRIVKGQSWAKIDDNG